MMDWLKETFQFLTNVEQIVSWGGTFMVCAIVFVETGLFVGFFLPGDSLLVTAGLFAAKGHLSLWPLLFLTTLCAIIGDQVGFWIGRSAGRALYSRPDSMFFKRKHLEKAHDFYEKYGGKTIVLARFVPIVRTFAPFVAGIGLMNYRVFVAFSALGSIAWISGFALLGYFFGNIPFIKNNLTMMVLAIVLISFLPAIRQIIRHRRQAAQAD